MFIYTHIVNTFHQHHHHVAYKLSLGGSQISIWIDSFNKETGLEILSSGVPTLFGSHTKRTQLAKFALFHTYFELLEFVIHSLLGV